MQDTNAIISMYESLPQRAHIPVETFKQWIAGVMEVDPDRLGWHLRRAFGFGGSEMGGLLSSFDGEYVAFENQRADYIVRSKLLQVIPSGGSGDTRRGTVLEPHAIEDFLKRHDAVIDQEAMDLVAHHYAHAEHPLVVGNPDLVVLWNGKRFLLDVKVPNSKNVAALRAGRVHFDYQVQTHHYRSILESHGVKIDEMGICGFDIDTFSSFVVPISYQPKLEERILEVASHYWNQYVMKGAVPDMRRVSAEAPVELDTLPTVARLGQEISALKIIADVCDDRLEARRTILAAVAEALGVTEQTKVSVAGANATIGPKTYFDITSIEQACEKQGIPKEAYSKQNTSVSYDYEKALELLENSGYDISSLRDEKIELKRLALARGKKSPAAQQIIQLRERIEQALDNHLLAPTMDNDKLIEAVLKEAEEVICGAEGMQQTAQNAPRLSSSKL